MISKNTNIKLAIKVENLIFLDVFRKGVFVTIVLQLFALKKGTLNNAITSIVSSCSA